MIVRIITIQVPLSQAEDLRALNSTAFSEVAILLLEFVSTSNRDPSLYQSFGIQY
jgi:hypothetical protein